MLSQNPCTGIFLAYLSKIDMPTGPAPSTNEWNQAFSSGEAYRDNSSSSSSPSELSDGLISRCSSLDLQRTLK